MQKKENTSKVDDESTARIFALQDEIAAAAASGRFEDVAKFAAEVKSLREQVDTQQHESAQMASKLQELKQQMALAASAGLFEDVAKLAAEAQSLQSGDMQVHITAPSKTVTDNMVATAIS